MVASRHITKIVIALMAVAVVICLGTIAYAGKLNEMLGGTGVSMEYESKLFNTDEIIDINIQMDESEWKAMLENPLSEEYYVCNVKINGQTVNNVAIRPKGNTSLSSIAMDPDSDRYSFKLEFDHFVDGQTCYGLDKLILNNNYADATNMKEAVIYDMFQYIGADASLYNYAKVSVNGEYTGVYLALEAVEDSFMLRNFGTQDGELYKPDTMEMGGGDRSSSSSSKGTPSAPGGKFNFGGGNMPDKRDFNSESVPDNVESGSESIQDKEESGSESVPGKGDFNPGNMPDMGSFDPNSMPDMGSFNPDSMPDMGSFDPNSMPDMGSFDPDSMPDMGSFNPDSMPDMGSFDPNSMPDMGSFDPGNTSEMENSESESMPDMSNRSEKFGDSKGGGFSMGGGGGANLNYTDDDLDSYSTIWDSELTGTNMADHRRVVTALKNISEGTDLEEYLDVDNVLKYMAVHTFSVNMDSLSGSMSHNYYLYEYNGQLNIFPWDYNLSLGGMSMGNDANATETVNDAIDTPFSGTKFFDALLENEEYLERYHEYLRQLVEEYVYGGRFDEVYSRIRSQIDELVETDPTAFYSGDEYQKAAEILYETIQLRAQSIEGQLNGNIPSTDSGQRQDSSSMIDASHIDLGDMGKFSMGGFMSSSDDDESSGSRTERRGGRSKRVVSTNNSGEGSDMGGSGSGNMPDMGNFDFSNKPDMGNFDFSNMPDMGGSDFGNKPDMGNFSFGSMPGMAGQSDSAVKIKKLLFYAGYLGAAIVALIVVSLVKRRKKLKRVITE